MRQRYRCLYPSRVLRHFDFTLDALSLVRGAESPDEPIPGVGEAFLRSLEGKNLVGARLMMELIAIRDGGILMATLNELVDLIEAQGVSDWHRTVE